MKTQSQPHTIARTTSKCTATNKESCFLGPAEKMFRRISVSAVARVAAARCYTPSEDLKKLYESSFESAAFPADLTPNDTTLFTKFLYKAAEANNGIDAVLNDFNTISAAKAKLPVFWERTIEVDKAPELKSLTPATMFTLNWMQANGMLEQLPAVHNAFESLANAKKKRLVATIYVASDKGTEAAQTEAKAVAKQLHSQVAQYNGYTLDFKVAVDTSIVSGFIVDCAGLSATTAKGKDVAAFAGDVDYTAIPAPKISKTVWEDSIETEVLRKYLDQLSLFDAEEAKNGV